MFLFIPCASIFFLSCSFATCQIFSFDIYAWLSKVFLFSLSFLFCIVLYYFLRFFSLLFFLSSIISFLINKHFVFTPPPLSISVYLSNYCRFLLSMFLSRSLYVPQGVCIALCVCTTHNVNVRLGEQNLCPMRNKFSTMVVLLI